MVMYLSNHPGPAHHRAFLLGKTMIVWHVTTVKKLKRYKDSGGILPPVRAWDSLPAAERFSKQTGRKVILRLKFPNTAERLPGHRGEAFVLNEKYRLTSI